MSIDNLGQTGPSIELPEDLKAHIENARNNVTTMEAEANRLQRLAQEAKDTVNQKHVEKNTLDKHIDTLTGSVEDLLTAGAMKKTELAMLEEKVAAAKKVLDDIRAESLSITDAHTHRSAELDRREIEVKKYEDNINIRIQALLKSETDHAAKVEKLKKAIE